MEKLLSTGCIGDLRILIYRNYAEIIRAQKRRFDFEGRRIWRYSHSLETFLADVGRDLKEHEGLDDAQIRTLLRLMRIELDSKTNRTLLGRCSSFFRS